jgi:hypothetical protein
MSQEQFQQNLASRQQRWQEQQHDPDFDRSYHRYAPREVQMYPHNPNPQLQQQQQYSLFGGGGGYSAAGQQPQQFGGYPPAQEPASGFAPSALGPGLVDPTAREPAEGFGNAAGEYENVSYGGGAAVQGQQAQYQYGDGGGAGGYQGQAQSMYGYGGQDGGYRGHDGGYGGQPQHTHAGYVTGGISAPLGAQDYQQHRGQVWGEFDHQYPALGGQQQQQGQYYQGQQHGNGRGGQRGGYSGGRGGYINSRGGGRAGGRGYLHNG